MTNESWVISSPIEQQIRMKIQALGKPLKDWDVQINYGVKTGYNEAFIINDQKREELIKLDPKSEEVIRPILRGKHIKQYGVVNQKEWIIFIPCGWTNINRGSIEGETYVKERYSAVYKHFIDKSKIDSKGKGLYKRDDQGDYWWEQRPCSYLQEFDKKKIIYIDIMTDNRSEGYPFPCFSYSKDNVIVLNTSYFMVGDDESLKYLLGVLNSSTGKFIVKDNVTPLQKRQYRMFQQFVEKFTIPVPTIEEKKIIISIVDTIIKKKAEGIDTQLLEGSINDHVFNIFRFNSEERNVITAQL